jgi:N-acetylglucosamine kinase-like BadF-type ATPase
MADGRVPASILYHLFREHLAITNDLDVCTIIQNEWKGSRSKIASLSAVVGQAASQGDLTAKEIFVSAASHLVDLVKALSSKLGFESAQYTLTWSGGVFKSGEEIFSPLKERLARCCPNAHLQPSLYAPDIGAALYAAKLSGHTFSTSQLASLRKTS